MMMSGNDDDGSDNDNSILSCSTTSGFCPANRVRGYILAEFCHSLVDFRANLSSLSKASLF
jgi:hypothetical protein